MVGVFLCFFGWLVFEVFFAIIEREQIAQRVYEHIESKPDVDLEQSPLAGSTLSLEGFNSRGPISPQPFFPLIKRAKGASSEIILILFSRPI